MDEAKDLHIKSIFKVTRYCYKYHNPDKCHWPEFKLDSHEVTFLFTLKEAEEYVKQNAIYHQYGTYAYVVTEIPVGLQLMERPMSDCFSQRVYLSDGSLWGVSDYATIMQC